MINTYKQGYDKSTLANHVKRTVQTDASFILPYIKETDHVLDVGCGPGTITTGSSRFATAGTVTGVDVSPDVLQKARKLADQAEIPTSGPGSVSFEDANVLERLPFDDVTFDVVFASQLLGHVPLPDLPVKALTEMRRVLKPGGILATRDAGESHAYPRSLDMNRLWFQRQALVLAGTQPGDDSVGTLMPSLHRRAGFEMEEGKFRISGSVSTVYSKEDREWLGKRMIDMLKPNFTLRDSWLKAGLTEHEIEESIAAMRRWADTENAWYMTTHCETLAWK